MERYELAIVGGGLASARAVRAYREAGGSGRIALCSDDDTVPYHRPPLSKRLLRGEVGPADVLVEPEAFYAEQDVELFLATPVARVDPRESAIELESGKRHRYERLLVATGARPRVLAVPGAALDGVFSLRTLGDSIRLREAARAGGRAVVVGAGFIGMEVAASLTVLGLGVTLVHRGRGLFESLLDPRVASYLVELYRERGVEVVLEDEAAAFRGGSRLEAVETKAGRTIPAEIAVVGIGVAPSVDLLAGSGVELDDGVLVDERFATSVAGVFAAGDVARFNDPVLGRRRRIEHWSNASYQGTEVGKLLAGADGGYDTVSAFFTEVFGVGLRVLGDPSAHDELARRGAIEDGKLITFFLERGRLAGALLAGQDAETETRLKELIRARAAVSDRDALADPAASLTEAF